MNMKLLIGVISLSIIYGNSFASQAHDPRIISHKEYTTGNVILRIQDVTSHDSSKNIPSKLTDIQSEAKFLSESGIRFNVYMLDTKVKLGEKTTLGGISNTYIKNFTPNPQRYTLHSVICADSEHTACANTVDVIELKSGDDFEFTKRLSIAYKYTNSKETHPLITTVLTKENDPTPYATKADGHVEFADE